MRRKLLKWLFDFDAECSDEFILKTMSDVNLCKDAIRSLFVYDELNIENKVKLEIRISKLEEAVKNTKQEQLDTLKTVLFGEPK